MKTIADLGMNAPPKTKTDLCETHGEFVSHGYLWNVWTKCPVCSAEAVVREREAEEARVRAERLLAWQRKIGAAGIPERFQDRRLETFIAETEPQQRALAFAKAYAEGFDEVLLVGQCAVFIGRPGTGKTHLAAGIGLHIMAHGDRTVLFTTVMRAVRRVKDTWGKARAESESDAIASLAFPDLLILDEVGVQFGSDAERLILFDVLNERYERRRPTILLSNLALDDCEEGGRLVPGIRSYLGERVFDRLREDGGQLVVFDWQSHRGIAGKPARSVR